MEARDGGAEVWKARRAGSELLTAEKRYTSRGGDPLHCFWEFSRSEVNNAAGSGLAEEEGSTGVWGWLEFVSCSLLEGL